MQSSIALLLRNKIDKDELHFTAKKNSADCSHPKRPNWSKKGITAYGLRIKVVAQP